MNSFSNYSNRDLIKFISKKPDNNEAVAELCERFDWVVEHGYDESTKDDIVLLCKGFLQLVCGPSTFKILKALGLFNSLGIEWIDSFYEALAVDLPTTTLSQVYAEFILPGTIKKKKELLRDLFNLGFSYEDLLVIGYALVELNKSISVDILCKITGMKEKNVIAKIKETTILEKMTNWFNLCSAYREMLMTASTQQKMNVWR